jgi:Uma2 family endonuclease
MGQAVHNLTPEWSKTTQAAEGLARRRFTVADVEAMVAAGIIPEKERIELIGGELVPMTPKGNHHEVLKVALTGYWWQLLPHKFRLATETTFRLTPDTYLEPDFVFYDKAIGLKGLTGGNAHLVVEIADSSFAYDIGRKALLYAGSGVRELWVIHAVKLETYIHRTPSAQGYGSIEVFEKSQALRPEFAPELAVTLADLEL